MSWFKDMYQAIQEWRGNGKAGVPQNDIPTRPISTVSALMEPCQM
jgi:hypothetical protein